MRKGNNPSRDIVLSANESSHRIIIPLHIPNEDNYYKDAFQIFSYCLQSVLKTSNSVIKISVISNGCSAIINEKLFRLHQEGNIDELIIEKEPIGKINSILKALRTANERLITITDADVLFDNGWEQAVLKVFEAFPKAGSVSPVPIFRTHLRLTCNIWFRYLFSKKLYFRKVKNPEAMTQFAKSIGWKWLDGIYKDTIATLEAKNKTIAVLGCSHFVVTYKREVFDCIPKENTIFQLGGNSESEYTDLPVIKMGGFRLATYDNYAYHMGNCYEDWMGDKFDILYNKEKKAINYEYLPVLKRKKLKYFLTEKLFRKLFTIKSFYKFILKSKGLTAEQIKNFIN
ncbi:glycosyltransferase [Flavobacterium sp. GA093]|uniref:Glycosyltransferase n=1 Tax=Flavobacterium hydrocarbonoxydans TaxID=2683249 RepID=A0A6I4NJ63_9FLAO|nr:glycosyltransferase family A protein [Flavobacterium hydrocarbonoxydans]MWB94510.1 glycosyltransferase [Flavobacterium hydrocarbonoxydans]